MKAIVTVEITIDDEACAAAGVTGNDVIKKMLSAVPDPIGNCVSLVTNGPEGHEFDRFVVDGRVVTAIMTREKRVKAPDKEEKEA